MSIAEHLRLDPGGWLTFCQPVPALEDAPGATLLHEASRWGGNLRYARTPAGVVLLGDVPGGDEATTWLDAGANQIRRWLTPADEQGPASDEEIETLLAEAVVPLTRRDHARVLAPTSTLPLELRVRACPGGALVEATIADLVDIDTQAREALAEFLCRAHGKTRFVRCVMDDRTALVVSHAHADNLDADLARSIDSVRAASHCLYREAQALLRPPIAQAFRSSLCPIPVTS
jgi:hypothetical protein